jgi:hypothetical protein
MQENGLAAMKETHVDLPNRARPAEESRRVRNDTLRTEVGSMKSMGTLVLAACLVSFAARDARAACTLKYYGGPVVSTPKVVVVFWGGSVGAQTRTNIAAFYTAIVNSPYIDWLSEYNTVGLNGQDGLAGSNQGISRGSVYGTYTIAPVQCGGTANCSLTDAGRTLSLLEGDRPRAEPRVIGADRTARIEISPNSRAALPDPIRNRTRPVQPARRRSQASASRNRQPWVL